MSTAIPAAQGGTAPALRHGAPAADASQQQAWQREMERAQLADWFRPTSGRAAREAQPAAPDLQARRSQRPAGERADGAGRTTTPMPARSVAPSGAPDDASAPPSVCSTGLPIAAVPIVAASRTALDASVGEAIAAPVPWPGHRPPTPSSPPHQPTPTTAGPLPASNLPPPASTDAPLRLHAEMGPWGQVVWLAMRADDLGLLALLPRIVADLQRGLQARGEGLHQVVCNGRLVWCDGNSFFPSLHAKEP